MRPAARAPTRRLARKVNMVPGRHQGGADRLIPNLDYFTHPPLRSHADLDLDLEIQARAEQLSLNEFIITSFVIGANTTLCVQRNAARGKTLGACPRRTLFIYLALPPCARHHRLARSEVQGASALKALSSSRLECGRRCQFCPSSHDLNLRTDRKSFPTPSSEFSVPSRNFPIPRHREFG